MDDHTKAAIQFAWGLLLVTAGVGLLFRIPQVMPQVRQIDYFAGVIPFIYFCMYFMAVFLIAGGARKLYLNWKVLGSKTPPRQ
jgi:hypothetical protein